MQRAPDNGGAAVYYRTLPKNIDTLAACPSVTYCHGSREGKDEAHVQKSELLYILVPQSPDLLLMMYFGALQSHLSMPVLPSAPSPSMNTQIHSITGRKARRTTSCNHQRREQPPPLQGQRRHLHRITRRPWYPHRQWQPSLRGPPLGSGHR